MLSKRAGFTLIELVTVAAIAVVLTALLLPVLQRAHEKVWDASCLSNTHQVQVAAVLWAEDHGDVFPGVDKVWGALHLDPGTLVCPLARTQANGYVYSSLLHNKPHTAIADPARELLVCDGAHEATTVPTFTYDNVAYSGRDLLFRHAGPRLNATFVDGHAEALTGTGGLPLEFRDAPAAQCEGVDTVTHGGWWAPPPAGAVYGHKGYILCNWNDTDVRSLPSGGYVASIDALGISGGTWAGTPCDDPRALINPTGGLHAASYWAPTAPIGITLSNPNDTAIHTLHLYVVDWDSQGRVLTLDVQSTATGTSVLDKPLPVPDSTGGVWLTVRFRGAVSIALTAARGTPVLSALAFD